MNSTDVTLWRQFTEYMATESVVQMAKSIVPSSCRLEHRKVSLDPKSVALPFSSQRGKVLAWLVPAYSSPERIEGGKGVRALP